MGARDYCPWLGRWTTADPLGLQAGINLYLYCRAGPVTFSDPSGLHIKEDPPPPTRTFAGERYQFDPRGQGTIVPSGGNAVTTRAPTAKEQAALRHHQAELQHEGEVKGHGFAGGPLSGLRDLLSRELAPPPLQWYNQITNPGPKRDLIETGRDLVAQNFPGFGTAEQVGHGASLVHQSATEQGAKAQSDFLEGTGDIVIGALKAAMAFEGAGETGSGSPPGEVPPPEPPSAGGPPPEAPPPGGAGAPPGGEGGGFTPRMRINLLRNTLKEQLEGVTEHGAERAEEAKTDPKREVGSRGRVVAGGRTFLDTETGNTVHVQGNRVVVTDGAGNVITQFKNSRANTQQRIMSGRWVPK